ncbi:DUF2953 domain-containing protein [Virgibacillus sp. DJP39]|uniref:DUF2953 domain-containing protein n=1 Tax=Virgibacillus sp. DJP39 TaxID=3409790 RepID=UPI003BB75FCD
MTWWLIVFCILMAIVIIFLFSNLYVTISFSFLNDKHQGFLAVHFLKIPLYRVDLGKSKKKQHSILDKILKNESSLSDIMQDGKIFIHTIKKTIPSLSWLLKRLYIYKFQWDTKIGAGEVSSTGMLSGGVWSIKGIVLAFLRETTHVACDLNVNVIPYFKQNLFSTKIEMKMSIRFWQAALGGLKLFRSLSKREKITIKFSEGKT